MTYVRQIGSRALSLLRFGFIERLGFLGSNAAFKRLQMTALDIVPLGP
jgi:hypothetical protein